MANEDLDALFAELSSSEEELNEVRDEVAYEDKQRSKIAMMILWLFAAALGGLLIVVLVEYVRGGMGTTSPAEFMLGVIKDTLLPIVTLVLGYYFGTRGKEGS